MKLENDLYAYLWQDVYENNCNTYLIHGDVTILIDPGHSRHIPHLFRQMEGDGVSPEGIDLILVTHSRPDHVEGLEAFSNRPARVAMSREEERYLRESGRFLFEMMRQPVPEFRIDFYLHEGELHLGQQILHIYETPGHSPGSLSIHWPERKVLFTGDLVFYGGIGRTDFLEGNPQLIKKSIERMSGLDAELLLSGHGEMVMGKEKVLQNFQFIRQSFYAYL
ncbi:MAG TPA: MBL fold metallo-hydrolase [Thermodesulfobacteriota bacterium]|nr:MBL fold metallo-hydrolase [Thermodesulfobacteriota bacterium]